MTDRELLELAAKAAGLPAFWDELSSAMRVTTNAGNWYLWRPLNDDGDALRLAVKLGLCFGPNLDGDKAVCFGSDGRNIVEPYGDDPYAATRRAIVRAAAEIGRAMP